VTRVLVSRHSPGQHGLHHRSLPGVTHRPNGDEQPEARGPGGAEGLPAANPTGEDLATWLRAAMGLLPPALGGALSQPLDVGRATRVVSPAQRSALVVRDGGCVYPDCDRPPGWCEAHHLVHWLDGGPTDLPNLALLCRAHHRAVHEGGWRLERGRDGHLTATPPHRQRRRHHAAA
jgi:HNH endonuclease